MPISLSCPGCGKKLKVSDRLAGKKGRCPECQGVLLIPTPAESFDADVAATKRKPPASPAADDEFGALGDGAFGDLEQDASFDLGEVGGRELPPRVAGEPKQKRKTFKTSVDEPQPKRQQYHAYAPIAAEPAGMRDHLFFVFALALIPLALSIFFPQHTLAERIAEKFEEQADDPDADPNAVLEEEFPAEDLADIAPPHLASDSRLHWGYAGLATLGFLGLLATICGRSASPQKLLSTGLITGTLGILMLLIFQWIALFSNALWLRGGGFVMILFLIVKLIGFSYICALRPDTGFLASFFGFTFGVGLCEEVCKAIPVLWYVNSPQSNWKGAMLVGMASGIGFGISEGIMYSSSFYNGYAGWMIYLVRFTSCVTLHAVWAGAVGLLMYSDQTYCTDIDWEAALMFVVKYLSIAMLLHGLYDTLLKKELEMGALAVAVVSWVWLARLFYGRRRDEALAAA